MSSYRFVLLLISTLIVQSLANIPIDRVFPGDCHEDEFFDKSHYKCIPCGNREVTGGSEPSRRLNKTEDQIYQTKSVDGFSCVCKPGAFRVRSAEYLRKNILECKPCPHGQMTSSDGFSCASCEPQSLYENKTKTCNCPNGVRSEVKEGSQFKVKCVSCPEMTTPDRKDQTCKSCHQSFLVDTNSNNCTCLKDKAKAYGGICIPSYDIIPEKTKLYTVTYENQINSRSAFFARNLQAASFNCKSPRRNRTACQILGNLCVLLHYSFTDNNFAIESTACMEFRKLMISETSLFTTFHGDIWPPGAPWLYYAPDSTAELSKTNVPCHYKVASHLKLLAYRYNAVGRMIDASELSPRELQLCPESSRSAESGFIFGTNYDKTCTLSAKEIAERSPISGADLKFYDLFLDGGDSKKMYPIPILVTNLRKNDELVNTGPTSGWQLVRRMFVSEALTGREAKATPDVLTLENEAKVVRFAKSIELDINLKDKDGTGTVYPPLLVVTYGEITRDDIARGTEVDVRFKVTYWMSQANAEKDISVSLAVLCSCGVLWSMFRTWGWAKRSGKQAIDPLMIGKFLIMTSGIIANAFFVVNAGAAINWFLIYKKQSVIHSLLPTPDQEYFIYVYLIIAFFLKFVQIIHELGMCCWVHIFFIDWERPKIRNTPLENKPKSAGGRLGTETEKNGSEISPNRVNRASFSATGLPMGRQNEKISSANIPSVSIWRTYFVANEWIELCSYRRLNLSLHIFFVIIALNTIGLENFATSDPRNELHNSDYQRHVPTSITCRVAVGVLTYTILALLQILYKKVIHERYIQDKLNEFVDLCSVSNVSVFCMAHQRFGYYVHGRSANGRADVNMKEMHELLKREEDDLCSKRGLIPNTDHQTFEMSLPSAISDQYMRMRSLLTAYNQGADRMQGTGGHISRVDVDKIVPTYMMINKFLSGFIEHAFKDIDYTVKEKTTLEAILDIEFYETPDRGFLYNDNGHSFERVMYYGLEFTLLSFEVMTFVVFDLILANFTFAAILTYILAQIIKFLFIKAARKNVVQKALVDERFLM